jgi:hypothetical protein
VKQLTERPASFMTMDLAILVNEPENYDEEPEIVLRSFLIVAGSCLQFKEAIESHKMKTGSYQGITKGV